MAKPMQNVRDLLRQFALEHGVSPDHVISVWSQHKRRRLSLDLSTNKYEKCLNWWTEDTLPQGHTLQIEALGQTTYVIITATDNDIVLLTQAEVAREQRDYVQRARSKVHLSPINNEVGHAPTIPPASPPRPRVSLSKVLKDIARKSGTKIGVVMVLWNNRPESKRTPLTALIYPEEKLSREVCTKLGLEFPTWKFSDFYFTFTTTMLRNGQPKITPGIIPIGQVPARGSTHSPDANESCK